MNQLELLQKEAREELHSTFSHGLYHLGIQNGDDGIGGVKGHGYPKNEALAVLIDTLTRKAFISGIEAARGEMPKDEDMTLTTINNGYAALKEWDTKLSTLLASLTD